MIDVNLVGPLYFVRIAVAYLKHNKQPTDDKSILLFSSVAGFCDSPGLFAYGVRQIFPTNQPGNNRIPQIY